MSSDTTSYAQPVIPGLEHYCTPSGGSHQQRLALDEARVGAMEALYRASGRADPEHPMHAKFTGLWDELCRVTGRALLEHALLNPEQVKIAATAKQASSVSSLMPDEADVKRAQDIRQQALEDGATSAFMARLAERVLSLPAGFSEFEEAAAAVAEARLLRANYFKGLAEVVDVLEGSPADNPFAVLAGRGRKDCSRCPRKD